MFVHLKSASCKSYSFVQNFRNKIALAAISAVILRWRTHARTTHLLASDCRQTKLAQGAFGHVYCYYGEEWETFEYKLILSLTVFFFVAAQLVHWFVKYWKISSQQSYYFCLRCDVPKTSTLKLLDKNTN